MHDVSSDSLNNYLVQLMGNIANYNTLRKLLTFACIAVIFSIAAGEEANAAKPVCVNVTGEGYISNGDAASAKVEAVNRAKWNAVEQVAGVDVKSKTVVEDSALLDDIITTQARGVVTGYKLLREKRQDETVSVDLNVCVEPSNAQTAVSALALNSSISVFIPARSITSGGKDVYDDENILAQTIIGKLSDQGFSVRDIAESHSVKIKDIEAALKSREQRVLRSLVYKNLSNTILIGRVEPTKSASKGDDIGHGLSMPFNSVTARLTYQLVTRDTRGKMVVLVAGAEDAKGLAPATEDAYANALKALAEKVVPNILEKIHSRMKEISSKVTVKVQGVKSPSEVFALRDILQKIAWVTDVEDVGIGEFRITFPENPIYLANGLSQKGFRIVKYNADTITVSQSSGKK